MLATMSNHTPIFEFDFSSPHRPAVSSPLSSSPLRPSQASPPLSLRDPNTLPRRETQSSPIQGPPLKFKYASRSAKPNPLRTGRENVQATRRKLFLNNVRQRSDDKKWERRGGDQEALKLEWAVLNRRWKQQKDSDVDGIVYENELDDIPEASREFLVPADDDMVDAMAQEEEAEMDAMLSMLEMGTDAGTRARPTSPMLSDEDEDYDALFRDILSQQESSSQGFVSSGQMDMS
ncbi:hypothetical protein F5Y15DRAFT_354251 [Xylariaceae sp. FL0016]|nr:hypothetical protein F5Y15DRAFT_354251 [Xylariaceae sp. FL0016]